MPFVSRLDFLVAVEFLRSFEIAKELLVRGKISLSLFNRLQDIYPEKYAISFEDAEEMINFFLGKEPLKIMEYLAKQVLTFENGVPVVKVDKLELFHFLNSSLDFFPLVLAFFLGLGGDSGCKNYGKRNEEIFWSLVHLAKGELEIEGNLKDSLKTTLPDLHLHLGGALKFVYRLHDILRNPMLVSLRKIPDDSGVRKDYPKLKLSIFTLFIVETILVQILSGKRKFRETLHELLLALEREDWIELQYLWNKLQFWSLRLNPKELLLELEEDSLPLMLLQKAKEDFLNKNIERADKLLTASLFTYSLQERTLVPFVTSYLILRNVVKRAVVQQHRKSDFSYFSSYSRSTLRRGKYLHELSYIARYFNTSLRDKKVKVEVRLRVEDSVKKQRFITQQVLRRFRKEGRNAEVKFIFHFIKEKDNILKNVEWETGRVRWENLRKKIRKQALSLKDFLLSSRECREYLQGIDVASKEYYAPPEVFAPVYNFFRHAQLFDREGKLLKLQFTYHVGEEFRHLLTGLRNIYEAFIFLNLQEGDRIGHGFALKYPYSLFRERKGGIPLVKQEVLDNYAFLYFLLCQIDKDFKSKYSILKNLEIEIEKLLLDLGGDKISNLGIRPEDYIDSWLLRRNCPLEFKNLFSLFFAEARNSQLLSMAEAIFRFLENFRKNPCNYLFGNQEYLMAALPDFFVGSCYSQCNIDRFEKARMNDKAFFLYYLYNFDTGWRIKGLQFSNSIMELPEEVFEIVQEYLESILIEKGIIVELLLTSNLLITPISSLREHPIVRLVQPLKEKKLRVVLGSDNPGIQETNILFEIYLLYFLLKESYGEKVAKECIEDIIKDGNVVFEK